MGFFKGLATRRSLGGPRPDRSIFRRGSTRAALTNIHIDAILKGDKELGAAFAQLERTVARKIMRRALRVAGKYLLSKTIELVPVRSGKLKRSLKLRALDRSRKGFGVKVYTGSREVLGIPEDASGYYPMAVEAGARHMKPRSYLRRAFDTYEGALIQMIRTQLQRGIDAIWRRGR